jgi:hypothetical protein
MSLSEEMCKRDACASLNLNEGATVEPAAYKQWYRKQALSAHPDKNLKNPKEAEERMKELNGCRAMLDGKTFSCPMPPRAQAPPRADPPPRAQPQPAWTRTRYSAQPPQPSRMPPQQSPPFAPRPAPAVPQAPLSKTALEAEIRKRNAEFIRMANASAQSYASSTAEEVRRAKR